MLRIRVTTFSEEEIEPQVPISTKSASLGEEVSSAEVISTKWTPSGVSKNGRCALLVHTQNLLLSIWAPEKQPRFHQDWKRRTLVNHELQRYFEEIYPIEKQQPDQPRGEKLKELIRIRAFGVSQPTNTAATTHNLDKTCFIAVSNDNNEVVVLRCHPGSRESSEIQLDAETHFSITDEPAPYPNMSWSFEDYMENSRFVQHLSWSPWIVDRDGSFRSLLACGTRSKLLFKWVLLSLGDGEVIISLEDYEGSVRLKKPWTSDVLLNWLPETYNGKHAKLLACTSDKVMQFTIDLKGEDKLKHQKYERQEWSQVTGKLSFIPFGKYIHAHRQTGGLYLRSADLSQEVLQILPHMTVRDDFLTSLSLSDLKPTEECARGLNDAVKHNRDLFDAKFDWAHGNVLAKLWGLAGSPLYDLAVTCATFHPSNSPEYIIPADMSSRIIFQHTGRVDFITQAIKQRASAEAITFSTKWLVKDMKTPAEKKEAIWAVLDQLEQAMANVVIQEPDPGSSSFKELLFESYTLIRLRYERIFSLMAGYSDATEETEKQVLEQLAVKILQIPASRYKETRSSKLMLANLQLILVKLGLSTDVVQGEDNQNCDICNAEIAFEDYGSAQCGSGHKFRAYHACSVSTFGCLLTIDQVVAHSHSSPSKRQAYRRHAAYATSGI
jgi:hypothetical protein